MNQLSTLSDRDKEQLLRYLGQIYRRGTQFGKTTCHTLNKHDEIVDQEVAAKIRLILRSMDHEGALILYHDFFEVKAQDWWHKRYNALFYEKHRRKAMNQLLRQLYQEV